MYPTQNLEKIKKNHIFFNKTIYNLSDRNYSSKHGKIGSKVIVAILLFVNFSLWLVLYTYERWSTYFNLEVFRIKQK